MINVLLSRGVIHEPWVYVYLKNYLKSSDNVLIIPFAFASYQAKNEQEYDGLYAVNGSYHERIAISFLPYQIPSSQIDVLHYYRDDKNVARDKIEKADVIYIPGGLPDKMMERLREKEIISLLETHEGVMIGSSAGAMIQLANYHITPDFDYRKFMSLEGLNLINDMNIEVHYRKGRKTRASQKKLQKTTFGVLPLYLIPDDGGLIVDGGRKILLGNAKLAKKKSKCS